MRKGTIWFHVIDLLFRMFTSHLHTSATRATQRKELRSTLQVAVLTTEDLKQRRKELRVTLQVAVLSTEDLKQRKELRSTLQVAVLTTEDL
jgi:hypothetical protein